MSPAELAAHPLSQAATLTLLHFLWQGLVIAIGLVAVVELLGLRKQQSRYVCSLAALLLMAACPLVTLAWICGAEGTGGGGRGTGVTSQASVVRSQEPAAHSALRNPQSALAISSLTAAQPYLLVAWLCGVAFFAGRLLMGLVGVRRLRRARLPLTRELAERVEQLGRRLGMRARSIVFLSRGVGEAMAVGLVRPLVLIPAAWATEMPLAMLEAVIAHELAHLQRRDLWIVLLQRVVETLLFYHPAVWWLSRRLRVERELCCDELAVAVTGRRLEYVQALETVARRGVRVEPLLAAGIRGGNNMQLLERVRNVLGLSTAGERSRLWPAGLLALLLPLAAWAWSAGLIAPQTTVAVADDDRDDADDRDDDDDADERKGRRDRDDDEDDDEGDDDDDDEDGDDDDDDEKEVRKAGSKERDDDDDDDEKVIRKEGVRKEGEKERDGDDREEKEVRKEGARKEIRKEGDDAEAAERKIKRIEQLKFLGKEEEVRKDGVKKEGPRDGEKPVKVGPKDGEKVAKDDERRFAELAGMVKKLMAENERLRAELAEVRGGKREFSIKEKEGAFREKEAISEKEALNRAIRDKEAFAEKEAYRRAFKEKEALAEKEGYSRALKEKEAIAEKDEAVARERKIKAAEAAEREKKEGEKQ